MEYFFDYMLERISGDSDVAKPQLFFERDYRTPGLPYSLFAVTDDWLGKQDVFRSLTAGKANALNSLKFDSLTIGFEKFAKDFKKVDNCPVKIECDFSEYFKAGCRVNLASDASSSGTGFISMTKNGNEVAKFYFAVNLRMRKRVGCRLKRKNDKLICYLSCKNASDKFAVAAIGDSNRLPCLDNDRNDLTGETKVVDLVSKSKTRVVFDLGDSPKDMKFSLFFADADGCLGAETAKKYYLLDIYENNTVEIVHPKTEFILNYSCPFCHNKMDADLVKEKRYRNDCMACDGKMTLYINGGHGKDMICAKDYKKEQGAVKRLMPHDYLGHDVFKIGFIGSSRAGKTTYISRFFGLDCDGSVTHLTMEMTANSLAELGIDIKNAPIRKLEPRKSGSGKGFNHTVQLNNWTDEMQGYKDRAISLREGMFPNMTESKTNYLDFPFIAEVNRKTYAAFYDIAGEDTQKESVIASIAPQGEVIGVFCVINGEPDSNLNQQVFQRLTEAGLDKRCPIAIILAKMDTLEDKFDSNCHCLRTDYFDSGKGVYDGSLLEWEIDYSSEEIESYLISSGLAPGLGKDYENIKYFGVSAFNFNESIHVDGEGLNSVGKLRFECSAKRLELPFIWMMRQFSVIK